MDLAPYTGHVTPGHPAGKKVGGASGLGITKLSVGPMDNNAYLLTDLETGERLLIDAANDVEVLPDAATVVTTHQHGDHWQALEAYVARTAARTIAHPLDAGGLPVTPDVLVSHGDTVTVGTKSLSVIHLRGHTPGSIALLWDGDGGHVFTGDCLFPGGVGNTQQDADRFAQLVDDVSSRLFDVLPDSAHVYPGHGDDTTIGAERPHLAEWRSRGW